MMSSEKLFYFNPRLREGGDPVVCPCPNAVCISIHASAKEATKYYLSTMGRNLLFQSTPPRRRRPQQTNPDDIHGGISIHASAKEATRSCEGCRKRCGFQSTPPRRRRPFFGTGTIGILLISIHASAKEATQNCFCNEHRF